MVTINPSIFTSPRPPLCCLTRLFDEFFTPSSNNHKIIVTIVTIVTYPGKPHEIKENR
jgi:hypothetical protein